MNKITRFLLVLLVLSTLPLAFSSCGECEHVWDEGYIAKEATFEEEGYRIYTCTECKEQKAEEIKKLPHKPKDHTYNKSKWGGDNTYHWLICDYDDCESTTMKTEHTWVEKFGGGYICQVCKAVSNHTFAPDFASDENYHWLNCTDENCISIAIKSEHIWIGDTENGYICQDCHAHSTHNFANSYENDSIYHFIPCTDENCTSVANKSSHNWINGENGNVVCAVCSKEQENLQE